MSLGLKEINKQKVSFFRFKGLNGKYLITNDIGEYCFLDQQQFDLFISGKIEQNRPEIYIELLTKNFIRGKVDVDDFSQIFAQRNSFLRFGPSLHIVVVTLRCDHKCYYCQAGSQSIKARDLDMDISTARKVVDIIFESPSKCITIEFQGGEPLANWETVKFIIEYAKKKNKSAGKDLSLSLVSNLTYMSQERLDFLMKHNVSICTSLDGPEKLHNKNRIALNKNVTHNSYKNTVKWLKIIKKRIQRNRKYKHKRNALTTITKDSLSYQRQIIDEFVNLGLEIVHLRPVNPFGLDKERWGKVSVCAEEFIDFYKRAINYIIQLNVNGEKIHEQTAKIFLTKILTNNDTNFLDMRSPCGAGIGQIAYNFNGDIYTCDEARMLAVVDDDSFKIGNVNTNTYKELINNEVTKTMCLASCLDNLPGCNECVYKPYCGVCPIYSYVQKGSIFGQEPHNLRCKIKSSILDYIFSKLQNNKIKKMFDKWVSLV